MKRGLRLALSTARDLGATEGTRDAAALAGRRHALVRGGRFPSAPAVEGPATETIMLARTRAFAQALTDIDIHSDDT